MNSVRVRRTWSLTGILGAFLFLSLASCTKVSVINETMYVVPEKLRVRSAVSEAPRTVGELKGGEKVTVTDRTKAADGASWSKVNGPGGQSGWVETRNLLKEEAYLQCRKMAEEVANIPAQAIGKSKAQLKLRLSSDRTNEDNVITTLPAGAVFEIVGRERKQRPSNLPTAQSATGNANEVRYDEWYKIRLKEYAALPAGWIYGGSVDLDIPGEILYFASTDRKIVGWQKIATLKGDDSKSGDHYLVIERKLSKADERADFDRVKVLAYDPKTRDYSTPFRDEVIGRFPVSLKMEGTRGTFRLTALDRAGQPQEREYQVEMLDGGKVKVTKPSLPKEPGRSKG